MSLCVRGAGDPTQARSTRSGGDGERDSNPAKPNPGTSPTTTRTRTRTHGGLSHVKIELNDHRAGGGQDGTWAIPMRFLVAVAILHSVSLAGASSAASPLATWRVCRVFFCSCADVGTHWGTQSKER